jgi:Toprim domain
MASSFASKKSSGGICPRCGYRLSNFKVRNRCFNCDYQERGSDGPWAAGVPDQHLIWDAQAIWESSSIPLIGHEDQFKIREVIEYLKQRRIFELAATCDQLRGSWGLNRSLNMRAYGSQLVGRIWHVRNGFVGVHVTRIEWIGGEPPYERDERRTVGACRGGAVWLGTVTPNAELVVGEGIETTLSAMILWGARAGAATLGTAGLTSLVLPQAAKRVVIAADNDVPAPDKIGAGLKAARTAKRLWLAEDPTIDVEIRIPPPPKAGEYKRDWNNVLMESAHV